MPFFTPSLNSCHRHCQLSALSSGQRHRQCARSQASAVEAPKAEAQLVLRFGSKVIPHPDKESYGGEDAFFTSPVGGGAMGISDGVSSWSQQGVNPADYSRTLMHLACAFLEGKNVHPVGPKDLKEGTVPDMPPSDSQKPDMSMDESLPEETAECSDSGVHSVRGALAAAHAGTRMPGSATACVIRLDRAHSKLFAANLGDSGFLVARQGGIVFQTTPVQHFWDCPLQFAAHPDYASATDHASDATVVELEVNPGDVIVAGTDGLWDNLPVDEVLALLPQDADQAGQAAIRMAEAASAHAVDEEYDSPYMQLARQQGLDLPWWQKVRSASFNDGKFSLGGLKGGKLDDITVLIAVVESQSAPPTDSVDSEDSNTNGSSASVASPSGAEEPGSNGAQGAAS